MDFSAFNPLSTNSLNYASRNNNINEVKRLLKTKNPNNTDNRGWTCLHEAAANDNTECLKLILEHPDCRPLCETFEGHTALYLACFNKCSIKTLKLLLDNVDNIANHTSTEMVSPLHVLCQQGRIEAIELLLRYDIIIDLQDFDGDTPLHEAAYWEHEEALRILLHRGANADIKNSAGLTAFHLACMKGSLECVQTLFPFIIDINERSNNLETPLTVAVNKQVVEFLLENGADPHVYNVDNDIPLTLALMHGQADIFKIFLGITDIDFIPENIVSLSCVPHHFDIDIIRALLESDLGPEFFNKNESFSVTLETINGCTPNYHLCTPLAPLLHISEYVYNISTDMMEEFFYLYLSRGVNVDPLSLYEVSPLVYLHYCENSNSYKDIIDILITMGTNVDYFTKLPLPDVIFASIATGGHTLSHLMTFTLACDHSDVLKFITKANFFGRLKPEALKELLILSEAAEVSNLEEILMTPFKLKQLARTQIRTSLYNTCKSTKQFLSVLPQLELPNHLKLYLRYIL